MELTASAPGPTPESRPHADIRGLSIFVLVDALGWAIIHNRGFLEDLLPHRCRLRTVLGYSSAAIPTILTGKSPAEHGHWNLLLRDPDHSPFSWLRHLAFLPDAALDNRVSRRLIKELGRRVLGLGPLFECCTSPRLLPLLGWSDCVNPFAPGGIPGSRSVFDSYQAARVSYRAYTYHDLTDDQALIRARQDLAAGQTEVLFLYLSEIDHFLHLHCHDEARIDARLAQLADDLRALFELSLEIDETAHLAIFSDHGMTPIRERVDLAAGIDSLGIKSPEEMLALYDSTMARFWFFTKDAADTARAYLESLSYGSVLTTAELEELGLGFEDDRYGQLIYLLDPGLLLGGSGFNSSGWRPRGMHGYHPDDPTSDGVFLSNQEPAVPMRTIADMHRVLLGERT